jgi:tetratricopeptide (TPR) repeat protein
MRKSRTRLLCAAVLVALAAAAGGCRIGGGEGGEIRAAFKEAAPKPQWWDRVSTKGVKIETYADLLAYWQNDERSDNQFFKAAYEAIQRNPADDDLVVNAVNLMPHGDSAYPHTVTMLEFAMDHYFDYDRPLGNDLGKPGDTVAGVVRQLAGVYNDAGDYAYTVALVEKLLYLRENEVNDQLLELISIEYAEALYTLGRKDAAIVALQTAIDRYEGDWEERLALQLKKYQRRRH